MPRTTDARRLALAATERLVRQQGAAATGLTQIIAESGAPKGSFYFHFPGGKEQLLLEMLDGYADGVASAIERLGTAVPGDAAAFADALLGAIASDMARDGFGQGCALQALAQEYAHRDCAVAIAVGRHSARWQAALAGVFVARGMDGAAARAAALRLITIVHGARVMARVLKSSSPFAVARAGLTRAFADVG